MKTASPGYGPDGIRLAARYRDARAGKAPSLIEPGRPYQDEIDCWATSNLRRGHRIRPRITSSCFPRWDRNPNTGHPYLTLAPECAAAPTPLPYLLVLMASSERTGVRMLYGREVAW